MRAGTCGFLLSSDGLNIHTNTSTRSACANRPSNEQMSVRKPGHLQPRDERWTARTVPRIAIRVVSKESKSRIRHSLIGPGKFAATMLQRRYAVHRSLPIK